MLCCKQTSVCVTAYCRLPNRVTQAPLVTLAEKAQNAAGWSIGKEDPRRDPQLLHRGARRPSGRLRGPRNTSCITVHQQSQMLETETTTLEWRWLQSGFQWHELCPRRGTAQEGKVIPIPMQLGKEAFKTAGWGALLKTFEQLYQGKKLKSLD